MKRYFTVILLSAITISVGAQNDALSTIGRRHWKTATTLLEMASSPEQMEVVISEFELVKQSDPTYPDTYLKLGKLFFELGKKTGSEQYYERARQNYSQYKKLCPQNSEEVDDELYLIDSVQKMFQKSSSQDEKKSICWSMGQ